ncbi:MAG: helix-turn-helix domain-containing protein [Chloroflexi bacterium]|nr:helix-turn-helix domain-containing protein [Chloroflexota bacterium]
MESRDRILDFLQRRRQATAEELAALLGLAASTVRRHLTVLQRDKAVTFHILYKKRGRPNFVYFLTQQGQDRLPKDYYRLTHTILHEISRLSNLDLRQQDGHSLLDLILGRIAQRLVSHYAPRVSAPTLKERVQRLANLLSEEGFLAEYEETEDGFELRCFNCPYHNVAQGCPELCEMDLLWFQGVLQASVTLECSLVAGKEACLYRVAAEAEKRVATGRN